MSDNKENVENKAQSKKILKSNRKEKKGVEQKLTFQRELKTPEESGVNIEIEDDTADDEVEPLHDLDDAQFLRFMLDLETETRHLELENIVFERFLKGNDLVLWESYLDAISKIDKEISKNSQLRKMIETLSSNYTAVKSAHTTVKFVICQPNERGPRINISQKTDMTLREMEDVQEKLETFTKKSHRTKCNIKAELEELGIRKSEIEEANGIFQHSIVEEGFDRLTQRIPAEKFVRYMEEWSKSAQGTIQKLRLRIATYKVQYKKVSYQVDQKEQLAANVHPVDFDKLRIENTHFVAKIELQNKHLLELKKMNGGANLILSLHKKHLQKQMEEYNVLDLSVQSKNKKIEELEGEVTLIEKELLDAKEKYEHYKNLKEMYEVPNVMEYVKAKAELHEMKRNLKICIRRKNIQDIALNACIQEMKNVSGKRIVDPNWLREHLFDSVPSLTEQNELQKKSF